MQVCIYVVMFVLPTSHNPLYGYINDEAIQLHQKDPDIVSQTISQKGKFGCSLPQNYATLCFKICCKDVFQHALHNRQTKVILTLVTFFQKSFCGANVQFRFLPNSVQGQMEIPQVSVIANFAMKKFFYWVAENLTRSDLDYLNLFQS